MNKKIENVKKEVQELLFFDNSGHGMDHINRVVDLSLRFAEKENVDKDVVTLIALLHDVDDYKLFGEENAEKLTNARIIMNKSNIPIEVQEKIISSLKRFGYRKSLNGIRPLTIEGQIVSDADMCDALGVNGILRLYKYSIKYNKPFFDKTIFPVENTNADFYKNKCADSSICHMFEKILKLQKIMMTESGKKEASERHRFIIDLLYQLFKEEDADDWKEYLDEFLKKNYSDYNIN